MSSIKQGNDLLRTYTTILFVVCSIPPLKIEPIEENLFSQELFTIVLPRLPNTVEGTVGAQMILAE